ncbi:MAG: TraB/GumN family protein [Defluviitaleaceae bacterium]|nr:TraB/GumN family protein [Defluviitaleaceae bacterium]
MKNVKFKRVFSFVLALVMVITLAPAAFASLPPEGAETTDMHSAWAQEDVFLAQSVFRLGNEGTFSNFRGGMAAQKFAPLYESLRLALGSERGFISANERLTRGEVIFAFYGLMYETAPTIAEAADYFIANGLLLGRAADDYQLDGIITVEETIALAVRVFYHGSYLTGNYSTGFFWEVQGLANTVWLLGSVHIADASVYPFSKAIEQAFARSANLAIEADVFGMSEEEEAFYMAMAFIDPESGSTIADHISEETYSLYAEVFEALGLTAEFYDYLRPWSAYSLLEVLLMIGGDADALDDSMEMGIDLHFIMRALASGKNIIQLESVEFQVEMLSSLSDELQEYLLLSTLLNAFPSEDEEEETTDYAGLFQKILESVRTGDEAVIAGLLVDETDDPLLVEFSEILLLQRDIAMTQKIAEFLRSPADNGNYFVVVGTAHFIGENSIVGQLTEMGFTVERVR